MPSKADDGAISQDGEDVEAYIAEKPEDFRRTLRELRALVKSEAPDAQGRISYGVIVYRYHVDLVGLGVTKAACSFYTMNPGLVVGMKDELRGIRHSGATLHFPPGEPLPEALIRKILRVRIAENEARASR